MDIRSYTEPNGRLVPIDSGDHPVHAFVPNPLPPRLFFDEELVSNDSRASHALGKLAGIERILPNPNLLIQPFMRKEAELSSRIEGTQADLMDLYGYEAGQQLTLPGCRPPRPTSEIIEVINYVKALEFGVSRLKELPVCLRLIREVHAKLMQGVRGEHQLPGEFRRSQNYIGPLSHAGSFNQQMKEAYYIPPPVQEMHGALDAFEKYLHQETSLPPLIRLALIHYQFEAIHPFRDGNGRIGRLMLILFLLNWGLLSQPVLYLSAFFERNRKEYIMLLGSVSERSAWREWVLFFLQGVYEQAQDAVDRAGKLHNLQTEWREKLQRITGTALPHLLMDKLFELPVVTIPTVQRMLDVSYPGAKGAVQRLVTEGILKQLQPATYGKTYVCWPILNVISE